MSEKLGSLKDTLGEVSDLNCAAAVLGWDHHVNMPSGGGEARGRQLGTVGKGHQFGQKFDPQELVEKVTGSTVASEPYVRNFTRNHGEIYGF